MLRKLLVLAATVALASAATAVNRFNLQGELTVANPAAFGQFMAISKTGNYLAVANRDADNYKGEGKWAGAKCIVDLSIDACTHTFIRCPPNASLCLHQGQARHHLVPEADP